jgi:hypothetical protein
VGELIALEYEVSRLSSLGASNPRERLEHVSLLNDTAGFDLWSKYDNILRYIEVKSSTARTDGFYISPSEITTLEKHKDQAFLYLVHVTDLESGTGSVVREIANPFGAESIGIILAPALYRATLQ